MRALIRPLAAALGAATLLSSAPAAVAAPTPQITWEECPDLVSDSNAECGRIGVPMNHAEPDGAQISVGFVRIPAADPTARRGTLFGNPGGPGAEAYSFFNNDGGIWPVGIMAEWDRVAVQPRGLTGSTPVNCGEEEPSSLGMHVRRGGFLRELCGQHSPGYPTSLTTSNTIDDWELVRQALEEEQISLLGVSYGTFLASGYATRYPEHTDRVVLDSVMNPELAWNGILGAQQEGYEDSLHDFMAWVASNNDVYGLGDTPRGVHGAWARQVFAETGTTPTVAAPAATAGDLPPGLGFTGGFGVGVMNATSSFNSFFRGLASQVFTGGDQSDSLTLNTTRELLPDVAQWDFLARVINGEEPLEDYYYTAYEEVEEELTEEELAEERDSMIGEQMQLLLICNENHQPGSLRHLPRYAWAQYVTGDIFTYPNARFASGAVCSGADPVTDLPPIDGSPLATRPLVVQGTGDPQTPHSLHGPLSEAMNAQVLTVHGNGHGHVAWGNEAVDEVVVDYLRTGRVETTDVAGLNG